MIKNKILEIDCLNDQKDDQLHLKLISLGAEFALMLAQITNYFEAGIEANGLANKNEAIIKCAHHHEWALQKVEIDEGEPLTKSIQCLIKIKNFIGFNNIAQK